MPSPSLLGSGRCVVCGCTDARACPGGCAWANSTHTLCSRCASLLIRLATALLWLRRSSPGGGVR